MELTADERAELEAVISVGYDRLVASRARMVLDYAAGISVSEIVASSGTTKPTLYKWIARYKEGGIAGLDDNKSPGRPRAVTDEERARIIAVTKRPPPESTGLTRWTSHGMAVYLKRQEGIDVSHTFVSELWREHGLKPRRNGTLKILKDPGLPAQAAEIVGIYLSPPTGAVVLSVGENRQFQALERANPVLPVSFGEPGSGTRGYTRHGTTNLFAALEALVVSGQVASTHTMRKRAAGVLKFVNEISESYPGEQEMHVIIVGAGNGEDGKAWLAGHPNFKFHYILSGGSWVAQIEDWFGIITRQAISRGSFRPMAKLLNRMGEFAQHWSQDAEPFEWTAAADGPLEKIAILNLVYMKLADDSQQ